MFFGGAGAGGGPEMNLINELLRGMHSGQMGGSVF